MTGCFPSDNILPSSWLVDGECGECPNSFASCVSDIEGGTNVDN